MTLVSSNVVVAAVILGVAGAAAQLIVQLTGSHSVGAFPWRTPLIWIVAFLTSRGVAQLVLQRWRKTPSYGFWVIGITIALAIPFLLDLRWSGAPAESFKPSVVQLVAWAGIALVALALSTPWLINKRPAEMKRAWQPLIVWASFMALFVAMSVFEGRW